MHNCSEFSRLGCHDVCLMIDLNKELSHSSEVSRELMGDVFRVTVIIDLKTCAPIVPLDAPKVVLRVPVMRLLLVIFNLS